MTVQTVFKRCSNAVQTPTGCLSHCCQGGHPLHHRPTRPSPPGCGHPRHSHHPRRMLCRALPQLMQSWAVPHGPLQAAHVRTILNARRFEGSAGDQRLSGDPAPHVELCAADVYSGYTHSVCVYCSSPSVSSRDKSRTDLLNQALKSALLACPRC